MDGFFDSPISKIDELLEKSDLSQLTPEQLKLVEKISERFDLEQVMGSLTNFKQKIIAIKEKVGKKLKDAAETTAKLGFDYEYSRLTSEQTLIEATIPNDAIEALHVKLIKGDLKPLIDSINNNQGPELSRFLQQKTTKINHAVGFSFNFGSWNAVSKGINEENFIERKNSQGHVQAFFQGLRGYKTSWGRDNWEFFLDFNATMQDYSANEIPLASEFDMSLNLIRKQVEDDVNELNLRHIIDNAAVWQTVANGEVNELHKSLLAKLSGVGKVEFIQSLTFNERIFNLLLPELASPR